MRGRNNNNNNNTGGNRKGPNPLARSYESNGPDVKIRGNAHHVAEKYLQLARDAQSSGDPVAAESYLQHAEHYFRLIASYQQTQQIGYNRQPDDADSDGDDEDSGLPDRFASPQAPTPVVPQQPPVQAQPYVNDRQPAPAYGGDRNQSGERQPYGDRNGYGQQRQDRTGQNGQRRPFRDERGNDTRNGGDARSGGDVRNGGETRNGEFRNNNERRNGYERMQERAQQQERFNSERAYREQQPEQPRDGYAGEQPRISEQPRVERERPETDPQPVRAEVPFRAEPSSRQDPDDAPGLPSFITTPTRAVSPEPAPPLATVEVSPVPSFPGDEGAEPAKFPRRRRRTTRAAAVEDGDVPSTQPADE